MPAHVLMVPVHLDALYLKNDRSVVETMADFTRLPYLNGGRDNNPDVANLSEEILSQPFQDRSLQLKAGIHLHWALPDALTRGVQKKNTVDSGAEKTIVFPAVPSRWLVTRTAGAERKQWIVESDYLHPPGQSGEKGGISFPNLKKSGPQPVRYLGRRMPLGAWQNQDKTAEYLETLTAVGYGEPTFAAFYPNCLGVFGFHDDAPPRSLKGVQYDIVGWYNDAEQDSLHSEPFSDATATNKYDVLREVCQWIVERTPGYPSTAISHKNHLLCAFDVRCG